jgi:hypothetical protein
VRSHLALVVISCALLTAALLARADSLQGIELDWDPSLDVDDLVEHVPDPPRLPIRIMPFDDKRPRHDLIGEARLSVAADAGTAVQVTTGDNVAAWVTRNFAKELRDAGVNITSAQVPYELHGEIWEFLATKGPGYNGDVAVRLTVRNGEQILWRGMVSGWARLDDEDWDSGDEDEYCEILSDAVVRAAATLVAYPRFHDVLSGIEVTPRGEKAETQSVPSADPEPPPAQ